MPTLERWNLKHRQFFPHLPALEPLIIPLPASAVFTGFPRGSATRNKNFEKIPWPFRVTPLWIPRIRLYLFEFSSLKIPHILKIQVVDSQSNFLDAATIAPAVALALEPAAALEPAVAPAARGHGSCPRILPYSRTSLFAPAAVFAQAAALAHAAALVHAVALAPITALVHAAGVPSIWTVAQGYTAALAPVAALAPAVVVPAALGHGSCTHTLPYLHTPPL
ncbi:hypothetical protein B0H13DRAFT_2284085 [Mycena leptocephala]|nr:hypothetical protein B0H13DRAFT_2284085 [Mycena leptocephala]